MTTSKLELQMSTRGTKFKWCVRKINGKPQRYKNYDDSDESTLIKDLIAKIPKYKQYGVQYRVVKLTEEVMSQ